MSDQILTVSAPTRKMEVPDGLDERLDKCIHYSALQAMLAGGRDIEEHCQEWCYVCDGYNQKCPEYLPLRAVYFKEAEDV